MSEETLTADQLHDLRKRVAANDAYTKEEIRTAVRLLVGDRIRAAQAAALPKRGGRGKAVNLDDLLTAPPPAEVNLDDLLAPK